MPQFRKKPVVIDAVQWDGDQATYDQIAKWRRVHDAPDSDHDLIIPTLEGDHRALLNDWIIRGIKGECYPCKPDIFAETYDAVP
jgi:hypothetical protein